MRAVEHQHSPHQIVIMNGFGVQINGLTRCTAPFEAGRLRSSTRRGKLAGLAAALVTIELRCISGAMTINARMFR